MLVLQSWRLSSVAVLGEMQQTRKQYISYRPNMEDMAGSYELVGHHSSSWLIRSRRKSNRRCSTNLSFSCFSRFCSPTTSNIEIVEIIHNKVKVLIAAAVAAAIGQISKPFTSSILYGKDDGNFDFKDAFRAGGFPSTHSSAAVATATTLGLERGLSDSVFGLAVVYACLIMYDAQGVRREVGSHAKVINEVLFTNTLDTNSSGDHDAKTESFSGDLSSNLDTKELKFKSRLRNASLLLESDTRAQSTTFEASSLHASRIRGESKSIPFACFPLKESVGHTEIEVIAGALLGFFVGIAVSAIS